MIVTGRDPARAAAAAAALREETGGAVIGLGLDLESLADVRRFAAALLRERPRLDVLVNNAGAGYPERGRSRARRSRLRARPSRWRPTPSTGGAPISERLVGLGQA